MNEKTSRVGRVCVFTVCTSGRGVCRTHSTTVVRTIIIWKSISFGAHEWLDVGQDGETRLHTYRRASPSDERTKRRRARRASRPWCVLHGRRVPIIDFPRSRAAESVPWRRKRIGRRPPLFFRAFLHARRLSLTAGWKGRPRPHTRPVFILTLGTHYPVTYLPVSVFCARAFVRLLRP